MTPDEARALWPEVRAELRMAEIDAERLILHPPKQLREMIHARYLAGCDEFSGDWTGRDRAWCDENALEELADLVVYLAFQRVLRRRVRGH